jgi:hypothetical protein
MERVGVAVEVAVEQVAIAVADALHDGGLA